MDRVRCIPRSMQMLSIRHIREGDLFPRTPQSITQRSSYPKTTGTANLHICGPLTICRGETPRMAASRPMVPHRLALSPSPRLQADENQTIEPPRKMKNTYRCQAPYYMRACRPTVRPTPATRRSTHGSLSASRGPSLCRPWSPHQSISRPLVPYHPGI